MISDKRNAGGGTLQAFRNNIWWILRVDYPTAKLELVFYTKHNNLEHRISADIRVKTEVNDVLAGRMVREISKSAHEDIEQSAMILFYELHNCLNQNQ